MFFLWFEDFFQKGIKFGFLEVDMGGQDNREFVQGFQGTVLDQGNHVTVLRKNPFLGFLIEDFAKDIHYAFLCGEVGLQFGLEKTIGHIMQAPDSVFGRVALDFIVALLDQHSDDERGVMAAPEA